MKVIQGLFYMHLPDDFEGTIRDAINFTLDHIESAPVLGRGEKSETTEKVNAATDALWREFEEVTKNGGKYNGNLTMQTLVDGKWVVNEEL